MKDTSSPPPSNAPDPWSAGIEQLRRTALDAFSEVRGATPDELLSLQPPPEHRRLRRFLYGLALPFALLRQALRDRTIRRQYLSLALPGAVATLLIALFLAYLNYDPSERTEDTRTAEEQLEDASGEVDAASAALDQVAGQLEGALAQFDQAPAGPVSLHAAISAFETATLATVDASREVREAQAELEEEDVTQEDRDHVEQRVDAAVTRARRAADRAEAQLGGSAARVKLAGARDKLQAALEQARKKQAEAEGRQEEKREAREAKRDAAREKSTLFGSVVAFAAAFWGALWILESIILLLTHEHQDQLSRRLSLAHGLPPEDPETTPRIRIDLPWLRRKMKKRFRGLLLTGSAIGPLSILYVFPVIGPKLVSLGFGVWGFYWLAVFNLGRTRLAWDHGVAREPWFIRGLEERAGKIGPLSWIAHAYARFWRRVSASVYPACYSLERAPYEAAGLAVARLMLTLPVVYAFARPVFPVAAQHILISRLEPVTALLVEPRIIEGERVDPPPADDQRTG